MAFNQIPSYTTLTDGQSIQISGPNGVTTSYQYDLQSRTLYFKASDVTSLGAHGTTHISSDPIPSATCDTPGLMSSDDKCKLDAIVGTRLGVLGFQGAGFPDDGGWLDGDIILSAGSDFINLERIGNVIRFTVDSPVPFTCTCEECEQIFWIQDPTDTASITPPPCSSILPGINAYGEMKIYMFPESTIADANNISASLQNKGSYPTFIFKRYDDTIIPGAAEHEMILKRDSNNQAQTEIGWAFTPGAVGIPEMVWFMGKDDDGNQLRFDLNSESEPGILGSLLYNGHLITKKMGVIVDYSSTILTTNQYSVKEWNVDTASTVGNAFTAKNVWQYENPENSSSGVNPKRLITDATVDILPLGTLVDLWAFNAGTVGGQPIMRYYFSKKPALNPDHLWSWVGYQQFGDYAIAREELTPDAGDDDLDSATQVSAIRDIERSVWGVTGYDDPLYSYDDAISAGTAGADITAQHRATLDPTLPGLKIESVASSESNFSERPVWVWNRNSVANSLTRLDIGRPSSATSTPFDVVFRAQIDENSNKYLKVLGKGVINGLNYVRVCGAHFHDLPRFGTLRMLTGSNENNIYNYYKKFMFASQFDEATEPVTDCESVVLAGDASSNIEFPGDVGDIVEVLHQEYSSPVVRLQFNTNPSTLYTTFQVKVGTLDMSLPYESDDADDIDDYVRGLEAGYTVSAQYTQTNSFTGVGAKPTTSLDDFVIYDGGAQIGGSQDEYWNRLEVMVRDDQVWVWWNQLLIPPNPTASAALASPVIVDTPYFPIDIDPNRQFGKVGCRMWPGSSLRRFDIRTQATSFSEFTYGQLEVI